MTPTVGVHHRRPHQAGFMPVRSTTVRITSPPFDCSLKRPAHSENTVHSSCPSFDSVDSDCLWHILYSIGIPHKIVRVLEQQYVTVHRHFQLCPDKQHYPGSPAPEELDKAVWLFNCIVDYPKENVSAIMVP